MATTSNTTTSSQIMLEAKNLDFISRFNKTWESLIQIMGIMNPVRKTPGTKLIASKATVALQSGSVSEGDEIPLSQATVTPVSYEDIKLEKYRKRVTAEAVAKFGASIAVQKTDDAFLNELTNSVLERFYVFAQTGTLAPDSKPADFQMAVSMAVALVKDKFKKMRLNYSNIVVFVNTLDVGRYLGTAPITLQTQNGLEYFKNFLGAQTVVVTSEIPEGTVIATPADNIVLYYIDASDGDFRELGLDYTTGNTPTKLIGVAREGVYGRASGDIFAIMGMKLFAEYLDGIAKVEFGATV